MAGSRWVVVVVRAWRQGDDRVVRMTLGQVGGSPQVRYLSSPAAAGRQLAEWLATAFVDLAGDSPGEPSTSADAPGDGTVTREGRSGIGVVPTVSDGPARVSDPSDPPAQRSGNGRHEER